MFTFENFPPAAKFPYLLTNCDYLDMLQNWNTRIIRKVNSTRNRKTKRRVRARAAFENHQIA